MATKYWVGTSAANRSGTWSTVATAWSLTSGGTGGAGAPTTGDYVVFPDYGVAYTVTVSGTVNCAGFEHNNSGATTFTSTGTINAYGNVTFNTAVSAWNLTGTLNLQATAANISIYNGGNNFKAGPVTIIGPNTVNFTDAFTSLGTLTLTSGTLNNTNGSTITCGTFVSSNANTRRLNLVGATMYLNTATTGSVCLNMPNITNFSHDMSVLGANSGSFASNMTVARIYTYGTTGGSVLNSVPLTLLNTGATFGFTITAGSWFSDLNLTDTAGVPATGSSVNITNHLYLGNASSYANLTVNMTRGECQIDNPYGKIQGPLTINTTPGTTAFNTTYPGYIGSADRCYINHLIKPTTLTITSGEVFGNYNDITAGTTITYNGGSFSTINNITCTIFSVVSGNLDLSINGTLTATTRIEITGATAILNWNYAVVVCPLFTHTNGTVNIGPYGQANPGGCSLSATSTYTFTAGTINCQGYQLSVGIFSSNTSNARAINFGEGGSINLIHTTANTTVLNMQTVTNLTTTQNGYFTAVMDRTRTFSFGSTTGGTINNAPRLVLNTGASAISVSGWFSEVNVVGCTSTLLGTLNHVKTLRLDDGVYTSLAASVLDAGGVLSNPYSKPLGGLTVNIPSNGTVYIQDAVFRTATLLLTAGTVDMGYQGITCTTTVTMNGGTFLYGTISCTTFAQNNSLTWDQPGSGVAVNATTSYTMANGTLTMDISMNVGAFTQTNGTVNLGAGGIALSSAAGTYAFTAGTLNMNDWNITAGRFQSNNANVRTLNMGLGAIYLNNGTAGGGLDITNATNLTITGSRNFYSESSLTRNFYYGTTGGSVTNGINLTVSSGSGNIGIQGYYTYLSFSGTTSNFSSGTLYILGDMIFGDGLYTSLTPTFVPQTGVTQNIYANGKQINTLALSGTGTTVLQGALSLGSTSILTHNSGTLNLNGYTMNVGVYTSGTTNARSINFAGGFINITNSASSAINLADCTNFTAINAGGGFAAVMSVTRSFQVGTTVNATAPPSLYLTASSAVTITVGAGSYFDVFSYGNTAINPINTFNANSIILGNGSYASCLFTTKGTGTISSPYGKNIPSLTISNPAPVITAGGSTYFNGSTDYLTTSANSIGYNLGTGDFTFEAWINVTAGTTVSEKRLFVNWDGGNGSYQFYLRGNNRFIWQIFSQNSPDIAALQVTPNVWTHVACVRTGGKIYSYINGILADTTNVTLSAPGNLTNPTIGADSGSSNPFIGYISNMRLVKGAAVYTSNFTPPTNNLTAVTGTVLLTLQNATTVDASSNALTITKSGSPAARSYGPFTNTYTPSTTTISGDVTINSLYLTQGKLDLSGYTVTADTFGSTSQDGIDREITGPGTIVCPDWTINSGNGFIKGSSDYTISINSSNNKNFRSTAGIYGTIVNGGIGALFFTVSNSKFNDLQTITTPASITFTSNSTTYFNNFTLSGTAGNLVTLSGSTSSPYVFSKSSGDVSVNYLNLVSSYATGGARWFANTTSVNGGSNTGWQFTAPTTTGTPVRGQFMAFFF